VSHITQRGKCWSITARLDALRSVEAGQGRLVQTHGKIFKQANEMTQRFTKHHDQTGAAAVEFLLVMPTFFFLCMLILELSLSLVDRHFMKLAAFEAARSYMTETSGNPCAEGQTDAEKSESRKIRNRAKRAAALKMASVSPSIVGFIHNLGININTTAVNGFANSSGPFAKAISHLLVRLPSAWALTHVKCSFDPIDEAVTVDLTYLRAPEMPFVKHALWAVWVINEMNSALMAGGIDGLMRFDLGQHYFGVYGSSPAIETMKQRFGDLKNKINDTISGAAQLGVGLHEAATTLSGIPGFNETFGTYFASASTAYTNAVAKSGADLNSGLSAIGTAIDNGTAPIQQALDDQSKLLSSIVYATPEALRLIPMKSSVRLTRSRVARSADPWTDARAFLVAPFSTPNAENGWRDWARGMVTQPPEIKTLTE